MLQKQEFEARQAYQVQYLLALRDYHQARIQTELQAAQTAFDTIKSPFCLSRSDIEAIFNQQTESARLVVLVAQPGVNETVPASLRENVTQEIQNSLLSFVQTNFPLSSVAPVKFYGQFFDRSIFNTQTEVLKRLLGDIPVVAIYSDITDHQFFLNYELWGSGGEPISGQFAPLDYLDLIEQMEQDGLSEQRILIRVRKTIVQFHQLCLAFLTDLHYLGLNPHYEPQLCYAPVREEFPEEWLEPLVQQLRDLQIKQVEGYQKQVLIDRQAAALRKKRDAEAQLKRQEEERRRKEQERLEAERQARAEQERLEAEKQQRENQTFQYSVTTLDPQGNVAKREQRSNTGFIETAFGLDLEFARIPAGNFMMGSPDNEPERQPHESPIHRVDLPEYFMSRTTITQAQWKAVASLKKVSLELTANPSHFKDPNCPVETVNWEQCIEFCLRLSRETGKPYRLPSEAEWEYACRAGTQTPYHFGLVLGKQFANYSRSGPSKPIRSSNEPNDWGLYDMHGNVCEWCMDDWHGNYQGVPTDGSAWIDNDNHSHCGEHGQYLKTVLSSGNSNKLLRGGSWYYSPKYCRSADRSNYTRAGQCNYIGFRLSLPRT